MSTTATAYRHIVLDASGTALIQGTTMKVLELVREQEAYGWRAEELQFEHPYLSLAQVHAALAYYWDHKATLDAEEQRRVAQIKDVQAATSQPDFRQRLRMS